MNTRSPPGNARAAAPLYGRENVYPAHTVADTFFEAARRLIYSLCFDPGYPAKRKIYVFSNATTGNPIRTNRVSRFTVGDEEPPRIDPKSEEILLEWPSSGHDGGDMAFGRDGMFYVSAGDGSNDSDTLNSGQTTDDLQGAVLRIDVHRHSGALPYAVPGERQRLG